MARYPHGIWDTIGGWASGPYLDDGNPDDGKIVWHKTQGDSYPRSTYAAGGGIPHFTVTPDGSVYQHYDTAQFSRALKNKWGGVQTNLDDTIQIEIVGYSGQEAPLAQLTACIKLKGWIERTHNIPPTWMNGRPHRYSKRLTNKQWDDGTGNCGHSDVPENDHWDPHFTDREWSFFTTPPPSEETNVTIWTDGRTTDDRIFETPEVLILRRKVGRDGEPNSTYHALTADDTWESFQWGNNRLDAVGGITSAGVPFVTLTFPEDPERKPEHRTFRKEG